MWEMYLLGVSDLLIDDIIIFFLYLLWKQNMDFCAICLKIEMIKVYYTSDLDLESIKYFFSL